jgi:hypothetical protein
MTTDEKRMEQAARVIFAQIAQINVWRNALERIAVGEGYYGAQAAEYKAIARAALATFSDLENEKVKEWPAEHGQFGVGA